MSSAARLSTSGAKQLMQLLLDKGYLKGADDDDESTAVVASASGSSYSTLSFLRSQFLLRLAESTETPARLVDVVDAASMLDLSMENARRVLSNLHPNSDVGVHQVLPPSPGCRFDIDTPLLLVNEASLDQYVHERVAELLKSVEKVSKSGTMVKSFYSVPSHISTQPAVTLAITDLAQKILHERLKSQSGLTILGQQHDFLVIPVDYMSIAPFPRALRNALTQVPEPISVSEIIRDTDTISTLRPDIDWILGNLDRNDIQGQFTRHGVKHAEQTLVFVPDSYLTSLKEKVLTTFSSRGVWTRSMTAHLKHADISLIAPHVWIQEAHESAVLLSHAVVHGNIISVLREAVMDAESWLDLQPYIPNDLAPDDIEVLLGQHVMEDEGSGVFAVVDSECVYVPLYLVREVENEILPSLIRSFAKTKAKESVDRSKTTGTECSKREKHRGGKTKSHNSETKVDALLPVQEVVNALLKRYTDLNSYVLECDKEKERLEVISKLCLDLFYSGSVPVLTAKCQTVFNEELQLLQAEREKAAHRTASQNESDPTLAFEDSRCFAAACYVIQFMANFLEYYETTIDKNGEAEKLDLVRNEFLESICVDFARRVTMFCLIKHKVDNICIEFRGRDLNSFLDDFSSPINIIGCSYPRLYMSCSPTKDREITGDPQNDPLQWLRSVLDPSVGKSVTRMWSLVGGDSYSRGSKIGDLEGFLSHIRDECITMCGLPFKILDKKAKKHFLNTRRQLLIQTLEKEADARKVLHLSVMHLFQHLKHHVVCSSYLGSHLLECLLKEKKVVPELSSALANLNVALECGEAPGVDMIENLKALSLAYHEPNFGLVDVVKVSQVWFTTKQLLPGRANIFCYIHDGFISGLNCFKSAKMSCFDTDINRRGSTRCFLLGAVVVACLRNCTAFMVPEKAFRRVPMHPSLIFSSQDKILYSSLNGDWEMGDSSASSSSSRDSYITESETAQQANLLASTATATVSSAIELQQEVSNSFLQYALSIILGRAIPDARDGLKPVHRRILYAMDQLSLTPSSSHRKCARVVGEVLGKFHPHGDMAVYDALVRLAQDFSTNHPLIDGHGNFGSIDADPAAAMRYTECKLTQLSQSALLQDLNDDTVDFVANFDGNEVEPTVLPARLPVLLVNGASGIAVGMATNVPPHNLREILAACIELVNGRQKQQTVSDKKLLQLVPAPDFPTGAFILGTAGAEQLYKTGNGGIIMRATTEVENIVVGKKGLSRNAIIITELPYQVNKAALLEKIASLVNEKKLEGIADLRDESDRDGIRVVIELKRDAVAAVVLNNLYKKTPLQSTFSGNFLALMANGEGATSSLVPQRFTLRQGLDCFLDFRFSTVRRKTKYQLMKVESRLHIVEGLLLALGKVDEVIEMIRSATDPKTAKEKVQAMLEATSEQTDSILRLQLGQLTRLNKGKLEEEKSDLIKSQAELKNLLEVDNAVYDVMKVEFKELSAKFGVERRSKIMVEADGELSEMDLIKNSRSVIVVLRSGYIKRMPLGTFESQRRGTKGKRGAFDSGGGEQGDEVAHCFTCNDHDTLLMVTQNGIAHAVRAYQIPIGSRTAKGQPIPSVLPLGAADTITAVLRISEFVEDVYLVLATEHGYIKRTPVSAFENMTGRGLTIATLGTGDRLKWCQLCTDNDSILLGTRKGMATRFAATDVRPTGRTSRGVQAMKLRDGDSISDMNVLGSEVTSKDTSDSRDYVLAVTAQGFGKRIPRDEFRIQGRGGKGVVAIKFKKNTQDAMSTLLAARATDEVLLITAKGIIVRQKVSEIPAQSRTATGVLVQRLDEGDSITTVSIVPEYEESDETDSRSS